MTLASPKSIHIHNIPLQGRPPPLKLFKACQAGAYELQLHASLCVPVP